MKPDKMSQGKQTVSDEQIIELLEDSTDPFMSATEVADMFDHTRQWAHIRLQDLSDRDKVRKKKAGESSVIWWVDS